MVRGFFMSVDAVLLLGSGPNATDARAWTDHPFDRIVAINNAWAVRPDWTDLIYPFDFPADRMPTKISAGQRLVPDVDFIPVQNDYGGVVYAGATMAFTAAYWVLGALRPKTLAYLGCDMVYSAQGASHFYGQGQPDPLRDDPTLLSLDAKSARFYAHAQRQGCDVVNLSTATQSRLCCPRARIYQLNQPRWDVDQRMFDRALKREADLGYYFPDGQYWTSDTQLDRTAIADLDHMWMQAVKRPQPVQS